MTVGTIIGLIVVGAIIGILARLVVPGANPIGVIATLLVGIVGAILGGFIGSAIGVGEVLTWIIGIAIAAVLVAVMSGWSGSRWTGWSRSGRTAP